MRCVWGREVDRVMPDRDILDVVLVVDDETMMMMSVTVRLRRKLRRSWAVLPVQVSGDAAAPLQCDQRRFVLVPRSSQSRGV